ncbi:MAG: PepSY domain-containing protein [Gaiella sp.]|nr:PepSY domain-containing protein [Gaiella sp.]
MKRAIPFTVLVSLAVVAGTGSIVGDQAGAAGLTPSTDVAEAASDVGPAVRALRTAERRVRNGRPYDLERETHRGTRVWEIDVAVPGERPHELLVSLDGRRVVSQSRIRRNLDAARAPQATVRLATALQTAARRADGRFHEAEIDRKRGRIVWEVNFERSGGRETEVTVDARTGRVVRIERD